MIAPDTARVERRYVAAAQQAQGRPVPEDDVYAIRAPDGDVEPRDEPLRLSAGLARVRQIDAAAPVAVAHARQRVDRVAATVRCGELAAPRRRLAAVHLPQRVAPFSSAQLLLYVTRGVARLSHGPRGRNTRVDEHALRGRVVAQ